MDELREGLGTLGLASPGLEKVIGLAPQVVIGWDFLECVICG